MSNRQLYQIPNLAKGMVKTESTDQAADVANFISNFAIDKEEGVLKGLNFHDYTAGSFPAEEDWENFQVFAMTPFRAKSGDDWLVILGANASNRYRFASLGFYKFDGSQWELDNQEVIKGSGEVTDGWLAVVGNSLRVTLKRETNSDIYWYGFLESKNMFFTGIKFNEAYNGWYLFPAELGVAGVGITSIEESVLDDIDEISYYKSYKLSVEYDYHQNGHLSIDGVGLETQTKKPVDLKIKLTAGMNRRITAIKIWRQVSVNRIDDRSAFELVQDIGIADLEGSGPSYYSLGIGHSYTQVWKEGGRSTGIVYKRRVFARILDGEVKSIVLNETVLTIPQSRGYIVGIVTALGDDWLSFEISSGSDYPDIPPSGRYKGIDELSLGISSKDVFFPGAALGEDILKDYLLVGHEISPEHIADVAAATIVSNTSQVITLVSETEYTSVYVSEEDSNDYIFDGRKYVAHNAAAESPVRLRHVSGNGGRSNYEVDFTDNFSSDYHTDIFHSEAYNIGIDDFPEYTSSALYENRLFVIDGDRLRWSEPFKWDMFPRSNELSIQGTLEHLEVYRDVLYLFTPQDVTVVQMRDGVIRVYDSIGDIGTAFKKSILSTSYGLFFANPTGIFMLRPSPQAGKTSYAEYTKMSDPLEGLLDLANAENDDVVSFHDQGSDRIVFWNNAQEMGFIFSIEKQAWMTYTKSNFWLEDTCPWLNNKSVGIGTVDADRESGSVIWMDFDKEELLTRTIETSWITLGQPHTDKQFKRLHIRAKLPVDVSLSIYYQRKKWDENAEEFITEYILYDAVKWNTPLIVGTGAYKDYVLPFTLKAQQLRLKLVATSEVVEIDHISLSFKPLRVN